MGRGAEEIEAVTGDGDAGRRWTAERGQRTGRV